METICYLVLGTAYFFVFSAYFTLVVVHIRVEGSHGSVVEAVAEERSRSRLREAQGTARLGSGGVVHDPSKRNTSTAS